MKLANIHSKKESHRCNDETVDDVVLMEEIKLRRNAALEIFYRRHAATVKSLIDRTLHNHSESDDVLVEVFNEFWARAPMYERSRAKPLTWLCTIGQRRAIDRLRSRTSYQNAKTRYEAALNANPNERVTDGVEGVAQREARKLLAAKLERLPREQERAVVLAYWHGMSQREIARQLEFPVGTVKTRIALGLQKLREQFGGLCMDALL